MKSISIILLLFAAHVFGQQDFMGKIIDSKTERPIPLVNIGFVDKGIGTTTNDEGEFIQNFRL
ncbi:hypothetical protein [Croceivirga lutea]|uniref:hypothetical protein n=1 Tax=Croceivirga lutea TaxID=1775167 RepID=UPI00163A089D|nr:hypothetical protein [Croceivirga lutea]